MRTCATSRRRGEDYVASDVRALTWRHAGRRRGAGRLVAPGAPFWEPWPMGERRRQAVPPDRDSPESVSTVRPREPAPTPSLAAVLQAGNAAASRPTRTGVLLRQHPTQAPAPTAGGTTPTFEVAVAADDSAADFPAPDRLDTNALTTPMRDSRQAVVGPPATRLRMSGGLVEITNVPPNPSAVDRAPDSRGVVNPPERAFAGGNGTHRPEKRLAGRPPRDFLGLTPAAMRWGTSEMGGEDGDTINLHAAGDA
jgi:hypothetical protein